MIWASEGAAPSLVSTWTRIWRAAPHAVVLTAPAEGRALTAGEVETRTAEAAERLAARGVEGGARVLVSADPSVDLVVAYIAVLRLGAVPVPANTAYTHAELEHICAAARVRYALADVPERLSGLVPAVRPGELAAGPRTTCDLDAAGPDDEAMVAFTSGTTGRPKAAVHLHRTLLAGAESVIEAWDWTADDVLLLTLPLFHMHGLGVGLHGSLTAGAGIVLLPRFDAAAVAEQVGRTTMFFAVPTMYSRLAQADRLDALHAQRLLVSGSAPLDPLLFEQIAQQTGQAPLERYGMTETVMITGNPLRGERRGGSVGLPLPGVEVRLADESGEVLVRGPAVFAGYESNGVLDATAGWFSTGDIGEQDPEGYLRLVGRASELIITGGYNVYPREVEDAVRAHPGVVDVAVVGVSDSTWGEVVCAAVTGDVDPAALTDACAVVLAGYKVPRRWAVVDELPRNAMGKVQRAAVRGLFA